MLTSIRDRQDFVPRPNDDSLSFSLFLLKSRVVCVVSSLAFSSLVPVEDDMTVDDEVVYFWLDADAICDISNGDTSNEVDVVVANPLTNVEEQVVVVVVKPTMHRNRWKCIDWFLLQKRKCAIRLYNWTSVGPSVSDAPKKNSFPVEKAKQAKRDELRKMAAALLCTPEWIQYKYIIQKLMAEMNQAPLYW